MRPGVALRPVDRMVVVDRQYDRAGQCYKVPKWESTCTVPVEERLWSETMEYIEEESISDTQMTEVFRRGLIWLLVEKELPDLR